MPPIAISVQDVPSQLAALIGMVAPEGLTSEEDKADFLVIAESVKAMQEAQGNASIALYRLFERNEKRGNMPRWVDNGAGRKVLDLSGEKTPEEEVAGRARILEMSRQSAPPMATAWDPHTVVMATGMTPAETEHYFPTSSAFDQWRKARGVEIVSKRDAQGGFASRERESPAAAAELAKDRVEEGMAHLKRTNQINDKGEVVKGAPFVPLPVPENGTNGTHKKRFEMPGEPTADEEDLVAAVQEIPKTERAPAKTSELDKGFYDDVMSSALNKARARGAPGL